MVRTPVRHFLFSDAKVLRFLFMPKVLSLKQEGESLKDRRKFLCTVSHHASERCITHCFSATTHFHTSQVTRLCNKEKRKKFGREEGNV